VAIEKDQIHRGYFSLG